MKLILLGLCLPAFAAELLSSSIDGSKEHFPNNHYLQAQKFFKNNSEILVAVIDTGISYNHPYLKENIYVPEGDIGPKNFGMDFSKAPPGRSPHDHNGHGTHVAGIIKSISPSVKIYPIKYQHFELSSDKEVFQTSLKALEHAIRQNVHIINYSANGIKFSSKELALLKEAEKKGILFVAAAGNQATDIDYGHHFNRFYPANYTLDNMITVMAHDPVFWPMEDSNWGKKSVDLAAPGSHIYSALPYGKYGTLSGTSMSTAFVSGVASLILAHSPELSPNEVKYILKKSVAKIPKLRHDCASGGCLDPIQALEMTNRYMRKRSQPRDILSFVAEHCKKLYQRK